MSESHGLTHKSFDGCESEKHLAAGCEEDASAGQGVFLFFIRFAGEHAAGGEDVFTARAAYGADYSA